MILVMNEIGTILVSYLTGNNMILLGINEPLEEIP
jgi:hypothetical protein